MQNGTYSIHRFKSKRMNITRSKSSFEYSIHIQFATTTCQWIHLEMSISSIFRWHMFFCCCCVSAILTINFQVTWWNSSSHECAYLSESMVKASTRALISGLNKWTRSCRQFSFLRLHRENVEIVNRYHRIWLWIRCGRCSSICHSKMEMSRYYRPRRRRRFCMCPYILTAAVFAHMVRHRNEHLWNE